MDRALLIASTLCFLLGLGYALFALSGGRYRGSAFHLLVMGAGFALQTAFLYQRGHQIGRCPLTNLFEVLVFLSWATVLFFLCIGPAYRLSLLGAFTAPLAFVLQALALVSNLDTPPGPKVAINPYLEFHAAFSLLAYGAFLLAGLAGGMYLVQEAQLKSRRPGSSFFALPPIHTLGVANGRLVLVGFILLTLGMLAGFGVGKAPSSFKLGWSIGVWILYGAIVVARFFTHLAPRRVAHYSVASAALAIATLWGITFISAPKEPKDKGTTLKVETAAPASPGYTFKLRPVAEAGEPA